MYMLIEWESLEPEQGGGQWWIVGFFDTDAQVREVLKMRQGAKYRVIHANVIYASEPAKTV